MKKFLLFLMALAVSTGLASAEEKNILTNASSGTWEGDGNSYTATIDGFEISYVKAGSTTNCIAPSADHIRVYKNAQLVIKGLNGEYITNIVLNCTASDKTLDMTVSDGSNATANPDAKTITWQGFISTFEATASAGQVRVKSIDVTYTYEAPKVLKPVITPNGGWVKTGDEITIACETADAEIYYTLDGDTPDKSATKYDGAITVTETEDFILTAVAYVGEDASDAVSADFKIMSKITALDQIKTYAKGDQIIVGAECVVSYKNGSYNYVYDPTAQCYGLIYESEFAPAVGDKIAAGWTATINIFHELYQLQDPVGCTVAESGIALPEPTVIEAANFADLTAEKAPMYVEIKNVAFAENTPATSAAFEGTLDTNTVKFYNQFKLESVVADAYNVKGYLSVRDTDIQILPIAFEKTTSGITDINATQEAPRYFNLQGVEVANPNAGIYIRVAGGKATKVLVD